MAERITDRLVKQLEVPQKGSRVTWDTEIRGFGVRITSGGVIAFVLNYVNKDGRERRHTVGRYGDWTVAAAREESKKLRREVKATGADPVAAARQRRQAPTVRDASTDFVRNYLPGLRKSSQSDYRLLLDNHILPVIGALKVASVTADDVRRVKHRLLDKPTTGNRALAVTSKLFSWAIGEGYRPDRSNPVKGIKRYPETKRRRYLSPDEFRRLSATLSEHRPANSANILRFLMFTGARSGEVFQARWDDIDLDSALWTKPGATTKQNTVHQVPLSSGALALLRGLPRTNEWVFPGADGKPVTTIKKSWATIRRKAGIPDVRVHDLRHSFASLLVSGGASLPLIGAMLGHTQPATTARYAHLYDKSLREAAELVGRAVSQAGAGTVGLVEVDS